MKYICEIMSRVRIEECEKNNIHAEGSEAENFWKNIK